MCLFQNKWCDCALFVSVLLFHGSKNDQDGGSVRGGYHSHARSGQDNLRVQVEGSEEEGWIPDHMVVRVRKLGVTEVIPLEDQGEENLEGE